MIAMARVYLPSGLTRHTGGVDTVEIAAARLPDLLAALRDRFPQIADRLEEMAVAIDGEIHNDADYLSLKSDSEVHFVPRIAGGSSSRQSPVTCQSCSDQSTRFL